MLWDPLLPGSISAWVTTSPTLCVPVPPCPCVPGLDVPYTLGPNVLRRPHVPMSQPCRSWLAAPLRGLRGWCCLPWAGGAPAGGDRGRGVPESRGAAGERAPGSREGASASWYPRAPGHGRVPAAGPGEAGRGGHGGGDGNGGTSPRCRHHEQPPGRLQGKTPVSRDLPRRWDITAPARPCWELARGQGLTFSFPPPLFPVTASETWPLPHFCVVRCFCRTCPVHPHPAPQGVCVGGQDT